MIEESTHMLYSAMTKVFVIWDRKFGDNTRILVHVRHKSQKRNYKHYCHGILAPKQQLFGERFTLSLVRRL